NNERLFCFYRQSSLFRKSHLWMFYLFLVREFKISTFWGLGKGKFERNRNKVLQERRQCKTLLYILHD
ncbi:MAG: hypothetical protein D3916_06300, partial [Candidatus Electrothrix sp. MAN1_4]|nr:hypothetical protein [Candidatus Electrothrix sp. MAN1_4]